MNQSPFLFTAEPAVRIIGIELCTPLGLSAAMTHAEVAADTRRFCETAVTDQSGEPVIASRLALIPPSAARTERLIGLLGTAFARHLAAVQHLPLHHASAGPVPVLLALPEQSEQEVGHIIQALQLLTQNRTAALQYEFSLAGVFFGGRSAFFQALAYGTKLLSGRRLVLVGGGDSYCDPDSLHRLVAENRVLGRENADGLIPGEAAGFAMLMAPGPALPEADLQLLGVSLTQEQRHFRQPEPNLADGLTEAFRGFRQSSVTGSRRLDHVISGQTGETYWAEEFSRAYLRNAAWMPEPLRTTLIGASLGDVGAAAGVVQLALTHNEARSAQGAPGRTLAYACADDGAIGACVVAAGTLGDPRDQRT